MRMNTTGDWEKMCFKRLVSIQYPMRQRSVFHFMVFLLQVT